MKNIIIIEDDALKTRLMRDYIRSIFPEAAIRSESSYNTGMKSLLEKTYDLLILDMSMPTFTDDFFDSETSFEKFAGVMILRNLKRKNKLIPTILFTMFDDFGSADKSISLNDVDTQLAKDYAPFYRGTVYFESSSNNWMSDLSKILNDTHFNS